MGRVQIRATPPEKDDDQDLRRAFNLWQEALAHHAAVVGAACDESLPRLSLARGAVDRIDGIRDELMHMLAQHRIEQSELEEALEEEDARQVGRVHGLSAEERAAQRLLATLTTRKRVNRAHRRAGYLSDALQAVRDVHRAVDNHRIEAITLLRAQQRISSDEYSIGRRAAES